MQNGCTHNCSFCKSNYYKVTKRDDGSTLTIVQFPNNSNNMAYEYYVYVLSPGPTLMEYNIYSNTDYFSLKSNLVVNSILSDDNLRAALQQGGIIKNNIFKD